MSTITTEELQKIVELANSVPEEYRQKCFELLLGNALQTKQPTALVRWIRVFRVENGVI